MWVHYFDIWTIGGIFSCSFDRRHLSTTKLYGPRDCRGQKIKLWNDGKKIDEARIRTIGTHADYEGFEGFARILDGHRYLRVLPISLCKPHDVLRVYQHADNGSCLPSKEVYWAAMVGRAAIDQ